MPRVYTKKAGEDYPEQGIAKGETYYEWAFFRQKPRKSKTPPTRVQLTQNDFLSTVYTAFDVSLPAITNADDLREIAGEIRDAGEELQSQFDEIPEGLQQGENAQRMEERASAASECADEMDTAADELETELDRIAAWEEYRQGEEDGEPVDPVDGPDEEPEGECPEDFEAAREEALEAARQACSEGDWD